MAKFLRYAYPWLFLAAILWSLAIVDGVIEAIPVLILTILAVAAYGRGVNDAQEGFIRFQTNRTVATFEEMLDDDER